jgi:hypothetical protein
MSAEKIININEETFNTKQTPELNEKNFSGRVDINQLLAKVRKEEKKDYQVNLIFFGLFATLILIVGILLSL